MEDCLFKRLNILLFRLNHDMNIILAGGFVAAYPFISYFLKEKANKHSNIMEVNVRHE